MSSNRTTRDISSAGGSILHFVLGTLWSFLTWWSFLGRWLNRSGGAASHAGSSNTSNTSGTSKTNARSAGTARQQRIEDEDDEPEIGSYEYGIRMLPDKRPYGFSSEDLEEVSWKFEPSSLEVEDEGEAEEGGLVGKTARGDEDVRYWENTTHTYRKSTVEIIPPLADIAPPSLSG
ncbi:Uu.00g063410.m01.CDS01 [Anthostomella pinea]|uniref:Uu.00g063410.m01.CDS01 n=1 Tax=Anthostomella pinea TaxID=933095 RepID=A0AAI8YN44_9PEZI|nr:Uu.00g063410.m01.CDS01 [Anthostomella pinea]